MQRWASSARLAHAWTPTATKREAQLVLCKCFDGQEFGAGLRALGLELAARGARGALAVFRLLCGSPRPQPEGDFDSMTGKFKILMYEAWLLWAWAQHFVAGICLLEDTCADWQICALLRQSFTTASG